MVIFLTKVVKDEHRTKFFKPKVMKAHFLDCDAIKCPKLNSFFYRS